MQHAMQYAAPWWLPGGNLQTIWAALRSQRYSGQAPTFRRERWATPDHDFIDVDFLDVAPTLVTSCTTLHLSGRRSPEASLLEPVQTCSGRVEAAGSSPEGAGLAWGGPAQRPPGALQPLLVVFHGLEGSSKSHYSQAFADVASAHGWACCVPHFRGCSGELNHGPRAYHSGDFEEIDWILRRLQAGHNGPLVVVGVSLGGNALMRWAGEIGSGAAQVVRAIASVSSPLDLASSGWAIGRGFNRQVYSRMFLRSMVPKALEKLDQHPGLFNRADMHAVRDIYTFDNIFTAPLHGFKNTDDYYQRASGKPHMQAIAVPALALNTINDPFIPAWSLPKPPDVSPSVTLWQPTQGGHVGFPAGAYPAHVRAMPGAVVEFFAAHL